jgi:hypothetical protein
VMRYSKSAVVGALVSREEPRSTDVVN